MPNKKMKIKTKLIVSFVVTALLILIIALILIISYKKVNETFYELDEDIIPGAIAMGNMEGYTHEIKAIIFSYITKDNSLNFEKSGKECLLETIESLKVAAATHKAHELHIGIEEQKAAEELEFKVTKLSSAVLKMIELKDQGADIDTLLDSFSKNVCPHFRPLVDQIKEHKAVHLQELEEAMANISQIQRLSNKIILISCLVILILALITYYCISSSITKPLSRLIKGTEMIGKGDIKHKIDIESSDEITELASAFNKMNANLAKSKKDLKKHNQVLEKTVKERTRELQSKVQELERFNKLVVDRELKMIDLKKKIKELEKNK